MKKICTIPDTHGNPKWKQLVDPYNDLHVFLGDYVDSFTYKDEEILHNLADIIEFARNYKSILLLGNHELSYFRENEICSGYRPSMRWVLSELYEKNKDLFKVAYQEDNYLFSHAGVSSEWWNYFIKFRNPKFYEEDMSIADQINRAWETSDYSLLLMCGKARGGFDICGGPFWADKKETEWNPISDINQVVGHTPVKNVTTVNSFWGVNGLNASITYLDCLDKMTEPYIIYINKEENNEKKT